MNKDKKMLYWNIFLLILLNQAIVQTLQLPKGLENKMDVLSSVASYCKGKSTNFCSIEHLKLIIMVERNRLEKLAVERQRKKVKNEIIKFLKQIIIRHD